MKSLGEEPGVGGTTAISKPITQRRRYQRSCCINYVGHELSGNTTDQLTCSLPHPVSAYLWVNYGCKPGRQCDHLHNVRVGGHTAGSRRSVTDPSRYTSAQAYCPLVACWRHQRIWVRHTLFASLYDRRLPRSEPKPKKKLNFWFFAKNRAKPNRVWKYQNRNKPNRVGCSERAVLYFYRVVV